MTFISIAQSSFKFAVIHYFKNRILPSKFIQLGIQTFVNWQQDDCLEMGAALPYYALFSLFPLCLVMLSLLGVILGPETDNYSYLLILAKKALPDQVYPMVGETLANLNQSSLGAGLIGFCLLLLTASKIFEALTRSVNKIWKVDDMKPLRSGIKYQVIELIRDKMLSFLMVLSTVFIFLLSFLSDLVIKILVFMINHFQSFLPWLKINDLQLINSLQHSISYLMIAGIIMTLFKILPSICIHWRDIWLGSLLTTALLMLLQNTVSTGVIKIGENFQAYGVIGNVMVLLLWNFLIFQIFFLGCELNYVYSSFFGSRQCGPGVVRNSIVEK